MSLISSRMVRVHTSVLTYLGLGVSTLLSLLAYVRHSSSEGLLLFIHPMQPRFLDCDPLFWFD